MSVRGRIEEARVSQSGKTVGVKIAGRWYQSKDFSLMQEIGTTIDGKTSSSEWNGKTMLWLNDWSTAPPTADDAMAAAMSGSPSPKAVDRDASIVAQALTKACTTPGDDPVKVWATYCTLYRKALEGVPDTAPRPHGAVKQEEFDDELPF